MSLQLPVEHSEVSLFYLPQEQQGTAGVSAGKEVPTTAVVALAVPLESFADAAVATASGALDAIHTHFSLHVPPLAYERVTLPCSSMNCGDVVYRSTLDPVLRMENKGVNPQGIALLGLLAAYFTACPGPLQGFLDVYFLAPIQDELKDRVFGKDDFNVGKKIAEGGFGSVYLGELLDEDGYPLEDVIVKKATEFGEAEVWMNERLSRSSPGAIADFITAFGEDAASDDSQASGRGLLSKVLGPKKTKDKKKKTGYNTPLPLWLVWRYEGTDTLYNKMMRKDFPYNMEEVLIGRELNIEKGPGRQLIMYKLISEQLLEGLRAMHSTGVVHRDVKPQNVILSETDSRLKYIDLGAAADLRVGINYVPNEFLLDPRFAPPQQYIMSTQTPKAPPAPIAALLSPVLWNLNNPDRFDMYSAGIMLMQVCFPPLRSDNAIMAFNKKLESYDYDLAAWRQGEERNFNREMQEAMRTVDLDGGHMWDLLTKLVVFKPNKRLTAAQAVAHRALSDNNSVLSLLSGLGTKLGEAADVIFQDTWLMDQLGGKGEGLTEAELSEMGLMESRTSRRRPNMNASNTIVWWEGRQSALEKKLEARRSQMRKQILETIKIRAAKPSQAADEPWKCSVVDLSARWHMIAAADHASGERVTPLCTSLSTFASVTNHPPPP
eukprot:CAMPEP_0117659130 /NCGR_PEP_ID=MMETSP0804-20121206/6261_1 /TAXON_ID=1074897 /ORGANISM="Tetraselmis astigmatica, Strain CCMP880" /LENGTH=662 /DNA_ID=CAMNT_0005465753 /DNA_START=305 /DNA_END=2295 /DNA_ORIENTATION=+